MRSADVLEIVGRLESDGIRYWIDGGWGVDALLEEETRSHDDLDLVITRVQSGQAQTALAELGFAHAREIVPGLPARIVLRDKQGRQVDVHPVVLDPAGDGWQELDSKAWGLYPAAGLQGKGIIGGQRVPCLTPELQLRHRLGYAWDEHDRHDMELLAGRFGLALPPEEKAVHPGGV